MGTAFRPARAAQAIAILYLNTILLYRFKIRKFPDLPPALPAHSASLAPR